MTYLIYDILIKIWKQMTRQQQGQAISYEFCLPQRSPVSTPKMAEIVLYNVQASDAFTFPDR